MSSQIKYTEEQNSGENNPAACADTGYCSDVANPVKWIPIHCQKAVIKKRKKAKKTIVNKIHI